MAVARGSAAGGIAGLHRLLTEHGEAVEADLRQYYQHDLGDVLTGAVTWRQLGVLVRQLPAASRTAAALHGETARWTPDTVLLADLYDVLAAANWQRGGNKNAPRPAPYPRPGQQRDRARMSRRLQEFQRRHEGANDGE